MRVCSTRAVRSLLLALALLLALTGCSSDAVDAPVAEALPGQPSAAEVVEALRDGGLVVLLRHTETTRGGVDTLASLEDCSLQRPLSDAGRDQARALGEAVRALDLAVGPVLASPFCRTRETAELAFGSDAVRTDRALLALASVGDDGSPAQDRTLEAAAGLAVSVSTPGATAWLVGHVSTIGPLTGVSPEEGGAVVVRPVVDDAGRLEVVGALPPGALVALAGASVPAS